MSRLRNFSNAAGSHFLTASTSQGRNLLQRAQWAELLEGILFDYRDAGEYLVHHYVIMPNHIHLLAMTQKAASPSKIMQLIKGRFSYELKRAFRVIGSPWQQGFAGRQIRTSDEFWAAARYIEENPVKARLCECAQQYPFSSANGRRALDPMPEFGAKAPNRREVAAMSPLKWRPH